MFIRCVKICKKCETCPGTGTDLNLSVTNSSLLQRIRLTTSSEACGRLNGGPDLRSGHQVTEDYHKSKTSGLEPVAEPLSVIRTVIGTSLRARHHRSRRAQPNKFRSIRDPTNTGPNKMQSTFRAGRI